MWTFLFWGNVAFIALDVLCYAAGGYWWSLAVVPLNLSAAIVAFTHAFSEEVY